MLSSKEEIKCKRGTNKSSGTQLRPKHGSTYTSVQYAMWAEMLVGGGHDEPSYVPMLGTLRAQGTGSYNMTEAFTTLAGSVANALSPKQVNLEASTWSSSGTHRGRVPRAEVCNCKSDAQT